MNKWAVEEETGATSLKREAPRKKLAARKKCAREKKRREGKGRGVNFSPRRFLNVWEKLVMQQEDPSKSLQSPPNKGKGPNFVFYSMANE